MTNNNLKDLTNKYEIILGSGSPRRVKLLKELNIPFTQMTPDIDETILPNEKPYDFAIRMSAQKGKSLAKKLTNSQLAISCDTIVILNDKVLGKPKDSKDAFDILSLLAGRQHIVATSLAFTTHKKLLVNDFETTKVYFNKVSETQIRDYIATDEPMDKAGAYGIQGMGAFLVDRIDGNLDNVIGFPRELLTKLAGQIISKGM